MKGCVFYVVFATIGLMSSGTIVSGETLSVARIMFFEAKPGLHLQMEEAIKKQMEWRREQKDDWRWVTWEYVSGEGGRYAVATFGHAWQDYDQAKISPRVDEVSQEALAGLSVTPVLIQYFDHLEEVSAFGTATGIPSMAEIGVFRVQFGKTAQFYEAVRQFHHALQKARSPERYEWFELLSGGEEPQFMVFLPRGNWAAFDTKGDFLFEALKKSMGTKKSAELFAQFAAIVKDYRRYAVRLRLDLSNLPTSTTQDK